MATRSVLTGRLRGLATVAALSLGLTMGGATGVSGVLAQEEDVTAGGGESLTAAATAADIEAVVSGILAEIFGEAGVADDGAVADDSTTIGGDLNVGGSTGGNITLGGGSGGISIGGGSSGSASSGAGDE